MKWHKFKKCLPLPDTVVIVHVSEYDYVIGTLVAISGERLDEFSILPHSDNGYCVEVKDCKAWAIFNKRSPWEGKK